MALSGSYEDFHLEMFKDTLEHELQQRGSLLVNTVSQEKVDGLKNYFTKVGTLESEEKTGRGELKNWQSATFERREITFQFIESDIIVDPQDIHNMVKNPQSDFAQAMNMKLGRDLDDIIMNAISGNATVVTNGSSAETALPSASKVAVNNHDYDSGSGDVELTPGKLRKAIAKLGESYVDVTREDVFVVAPMDQLMNLSTFDEVISADYRATKPLEIPGLVKGLDGYLGLRYIAYESTGTDSNSDDKVFVFPKSAVKLGIRQALTVKANELPERKGNPVGLTAFFDAGAVRMFEEKVIEIACNPIT